MIDMAKTTHTEQLGRLGQAVADERAAARELQAHATEATQARKRAKGELVEAHAARDQNQVKAAKAALTRATTRAEDLDAQSAGAQLRIDRAERERDEYETANASVLLSELEPAAQAAAEALDAHARGLLDANAQWLDASARVTALLGKVDGASARDDAPATHRLASVVHETRNVLRQGGQTTNPLPHHRGARIRADEQDRVQRLKLARSGQADGEHVDPLNPPAAA